MPRDRARRGAVHARRGAARPRQLGLEWRYGADGHGGPLLADEAVWGAAASGPIGVSEILFPRVEIAES